MAAVSQQACVIRERHPGFNLEGLENLLPLGADLHSAHDDLKLALLPVKLFAESQREYDSVVCIATRDHRGLCGRVVAVRQWRRSDTQHPLPSAAMLRHHAVQCLIRSFGREHLAGTRDAPLWTFVDNTVWDSDPTNQLTRD
jgi:hypothetical protein